MVRTEYCIEAFASAAASALRVSVLLWLAMSALTPTLNIAGKDMEHRRSNGYDPIGLFAEPDVGLSYVPEAPE